MKYLLCEIDDEHYSSPCFTVYETKEKAIESAIRACRDYLGECELEMADDKSRIETKTDSNEYFYVTEIKEFENKGNYILVYHHAYQGVDFNIKFIGDYHGCKEKMDMLVKESLDIENATLEWNEGFQACVDVGFEWNVFSIVEVR